MELAMQQEKAKQLRADIIKMLYLCQSGHPGGSLSLVEMLMAIYYNTAHVDPKNPKWEDRDRIVLSKGHGCPAQYAILADLGFFPREDLWTLRKLHSHLQGHPDCNKTPGIDVNTGSLGQGVSGAGGLAMAAKYLHKDYRVYAILGDGEIQEGQVWEAAESAVKYGLDNFVVLLDHNGLQIDGTNDQVMPVGDPCAKFAAFGFETVKVDGHDIQAIVDAIQAPVTPGKPRFICCETVKGKGVSFMENVVGWHGKAPNKEEYIKAMKELGVEVDG